MKSVSADANIEFTDISGFPGLSTQPTNGFVSMVRELANSESLTKVAYGTEAGLFTQTVGIPAVVCGPGSIEQAHKPNEWIAQQQLLQADQFLARLIAASSTA